MQLLNYQIHSVTDLRKTITDHTTFWKYFFLEQNQYKRARWKMVMTVKMTLDYSELEGDAMPVIPSLVVE